MTKKAGCNVNFTYAKATKTHLTYLLGSPSCAEPNPHPDGDSDTNGDSQHRQ
jgi:hypothetical protein